MKEDAVSPVVGVMLLLSLTIIIAAVLAAFAAGTADERTKTPSADIAASFSGSGDNLVLMLEHTGGDYLFPADVKITGLLKNGESNTAGSCMLQEVFSGSVWKAGESILLNKTVCAGLFGVSAEEFAAASRLAVPADVTLYYVPSSVVLSKLHIILEES